MVAAASTSNLSTSAGLNKPTRVESRVNADVEPILSSQSIDSGAASKAEVKTSIQLEGATTADPDVAVDKKLEREVSIYYSQ